MERLASVFRATWLRLPLQVRRTLLQNWRQIARTRHMLCPDLAVADVVDSNVGMAIAVCRWNGESILFHSSSLTSLSEANLTHTVAHELAHAYRAVSGARTDTIVQARSNLDKSRAGSRTWLRKMRAADARAYQSEEDGVEDTLRRWGFVAPPESDWVRPDFMDHWTHARDRAIREIITMYPTRNERLAAARERLKLTARDFDKIAKKIEQGSGIERSGIKK